MGNKRDNGMTDVLVHLIKKKKKERKERTSTASTSLAANTGSITTRELIADLDPKDSRCN